MITINKKMSLEIISHNKQFFFINELKNDEKLKLENFNYFNNWKHFSNNSNFVIEWNEQPELMCSLIELILYNKQLEQNYTFYNFMKAFLYLLPIYPFGYYTKDVYFDYKTAFELLSNIDKINLLFYAYYTNKQFKYIDNTSVYCLSNYINGREPRHEFIKTVNRLKNEEVYHHFLEELKNICDLKSAENIAIISKIIELLFEQKNYNYIKILYDTEPNFCQGIIKYIKLNNIDCDNLIELILYATENADIFREKFDKLVANTNDLNTLIKYIYHDTKNIANICAKTIIDKFAITNDIASEIFKNKYIDNLIKLDLLTTNNKYTLDALPSKFSVDRKDMIEILLKKRDFFKNYSSYPLCNLKHADNFMVMYVFSNHNITSNTYRIYCINKQFHTIDKEITSTDNTTYALKIGNSKLYFENSGFVKLDIENPTYCLKIMLKDIIIIVITDYNLQFSQFIVNYDKKLFHYEIAEYMQSVITENNFIVNILS